MADLDLDFVSLTWEYYDIVLGAEALAAAAALITALREPSVREAITALGGYDPTQSGAIEALTPS